MIDRTRITGTLPEIWGVRHMSKSTQALLGHAPVDDSPKDEARHDERATENNCTIHAGKAVVRSNESRLADPRVRWENPVTGEQQCQINPISIFGVVGQTQNVPCQNTKSSKSAQVED